MKKKLQVFLSSTYTDLIDERQAAVEAILSIGHIPAGMELFKAGNESQLETIKRWIDESDIYVLILGGRYGSLEPKSQLSYTQLEYEYAVKKNIPFFAVVIKDDALDKKVKDFGRTVLEIDNSDKYENFREMVLRKTSLFYSDIKDIKLAIIKSITDFEKRFTFKGWVSGDILKDYEDFKQENIRLTKEIQTTSLVKCDSADNEKSSYESCHTDNEKISVLNEDPTTFFYYRICGAFPGIRGVKWFYDPKEAVERLKLFFKKPIKFKTDGKHYSDPIWVLHGNSGLNIESFDVLSDTKILIGYDEIEIEKIAVYHSSSYYRDFIYIEAKAESPIGVYSTSPQYINMQIKDFGYASEEYALLGDVPISRAEFDDGAAVINGKVVDAKGAQVRVRYLSKYNFNIVAKTSPYNSKDCDLISEKYLKGILNGTHNFDDFLSLLIDLPKNPRD